MAATLSVSRITDFNDPSTQFGPAVNRALRQALHSDDNDFGTVCLAQVGNSPGQTPQWSGRRGLPLSLIRDATQSVRGKFRLATDVQVEQRTGDGVLWGDRSRFHATQSKTGQVFAASGGQIVTSSSVNKYIPASESNQLRRNLPVVFSNSSGLTSPVTFQGDARYYGICYLHLRFSVTSASGVSNDVDVWRSFKPNARRTHGDDPPDFRVLQNHRIDFWNGLILQRFTVFISTSGDPVETSVSWSTVNVTTTQQIVRRYDGSLSNVRVISVSFV